MANAIPSTFEGTRITTSERSTTYRYKTRDPLPYGLVRLTAIVPPVSLSDFKYQIRVEQDETYEDSLLNTLLEDATEYVQHQCNCAIEGTATWRLTTPAFPCQPTMYLPRPPLLSVDSVKYWDTEGQDVAFTEYYPDLDNSRLVLNRSASWPVTDICRSDSVRIDYKAGAAQVSGMARRAVLLLASHWFKTREDSTEKKMNEIPYGVQNLILSLRPGDNFIYPDS